MKRFVSLLAFVLASLSVNAYDFEKGGYYYIHYTNGTVRIVGTDFSGDLIIPSSVDLDWGTFLVDGVSDDVFQGRKDITSVTFSEGIHSIGSNTFYGCTNLKSVTIPESMMHIWWGAFNGCTSLTSVTIPNGTLYDRAFKNCTNLKTVNLQKGVKLREYVFENCSSLESVTIPSSAKEIGKGCFLGCTSLKSVNIQEGVSKISNDAFKNCTNLTDLIVPSSVSEIWSWAFTNCHRLTSVNLFGQIFTSAFENCEKLTSITVTNGKLYESTFSKCNNLKYLTLSDCIIREKAFYDNQTITSVTIKGKSSVWESAFYGCTNLENLDIQQGTTEIKSYAFANCNKLKSVTIPMSVTKIGYKAFDNTNLHVRMLSSNPPIISEPVGEIKCLEVPKGSTVKYASTKFWDEVDVIYAEEGNTRYYPVLPISSNGYVYSNIYGNGKELTENDDVEVYCYDATFPSTNLILKGTCEISDFFRNGTYKFKPTPYFKNNLISVYSYPAKVINVSTSGTLLDLIGIDNISSIQNLVVKGEINGTDLLAIRKMKNLKLLDLSEAHIVNGGVSYYKNYTTSKNTIGKYLFDGFSEIIRIKVPKDIEVIEQYAFNGCGNLITLRIPSSTKKISIYWMFKSLQIEDVGKWCETIKTSSEIRINNCHLYILDKEVFDLNIPYGTTSISDYSFYGCHWLESVKLPSTLTNIGNYSFRECNKISSITSLNTIPPLINSKGAFVSKRV
jgi:hypothetical protein